jgi:hypothetical protein
MSSALLEKKPPPPCCRSIFGSFFCAFHSFSVCLKAPFTIVSLYESIVSNTEP